jgi:hypothetical protein
MGLEVKDMLMIVIGVVISVALYPTVANAVEDANATGASGAMLALVPLFYVVLIIFAMVGYLYIKARH